MKLKKIFHFTKKPLSSKSLEGRVGYWFKDPNLKLQALTHKSFAGGRGDNFHNERLEFLGDAVFDLFVSEMLMKKYPKADEGDLSKMRACLVNTHDLAKLALDLKLEQELRMNHNSKKDKEHTTPRLLACVVEALVGAIYLDGGYIKAKQVVEKWVGPAIKKGIIDKDYKSLLQELAQKRFHAIPIYQLLNTQGPHHQREFVMEVKINNKVFGEGRGLNKKQAEQNSALNALKKLGVRMPTRALG